jgi:short-subunit dehydrogenase
MPCLTLPIDPNFRTIQWLTLPNDCAVPVSLRTSKRPHERRLIVASRMGTERGSQLQDRRCVVTGASDGIGRAIAVALASAGASVYGVARRREQLQATAALARGQGRIDSYPADLFVDGEISAFADAIQQSSPGIDVLVHSAGRYAQGPVATTPVEEFDRQYRLNVRAPYLLTQALLPSLRATRGQIVFINSTVVFAPRADVGQFAATQHALRSFADTLREEVNADGIRVVSIFPGRTATRRQARVRSLEGKPYVPDRLLQPAELADIVLKVVTVPWTAEITEMRVRPTLKS